MRKLILLLCILLIAIGGYSQTWKNVNLDSATSVSLPSNYKIKDSLNDYSLTARTSFGNILITKIPDNPLIVKDIYKKRHLDNYYKGYVKGILQSSKGTVADQKDTTLGQLQVKDFTLHIGKAEGLKIRRFRILHENGITYTFQFLYDDVTKDYAIPEADRFFNSIKIIGNPSPDTQFTKKPPGYRPPLLNAKTIGLTAGVVVLIVIITLGIRKRKAQRSSQNK